MGTWERVKVGVVAGDNHLELELADVRQEGATLGVLDALAREVLTANVEIQIQFLNGIGPASAVQARVVGSSTDGALDVSFEALSDEDTQALSALVQSLSGPRSTEAVEPAVSSGRRSLRNRSLVEIPVDAYRGILQSDELSSELREKVFVTLPESEKRFFQKSGGKGIVAELLALKMKMKHELDMFQEHFSASPAYLSSVRKVTANNRAVLLEHIGRLEQEQAQLTKGHVAAAHQVKGELEALIAEQESSAATIEDVVGTGAAKQAEADEKRKQDQLLQSAARAEQPSSQRREKRKRGGKKAAAPGKLASLDTPLKKVSMGVLAVALFAGTLGVLLYWDELVTMTMSPAAVVSDIGAILPVVRTEVRRQQLNIYVDETKLDMKDKAGLQGKVDRVLSLALAHSFEGVRVFTQSGTRLFYTGRGSGGAQMVRD